jgi:tagatose 6-phosphate kinase
MIVTVTLNVALDVTYQVNALRPGSSVRVTAVRERAGGKGVNVARVLHSLGYPVAVAGFAGGGNGADVRADLRAAGVVDDLVSIAGETRRTVSVVDADGEATVLLEPGPQIAQAEWSVLERRLAGLLPGVDVAVLSGSLPTGLPGDAYATLVRMARSAGVPVILDTSGHALLGGLTGGPSVVKPNLDELVGVTSGRPVPAGESASADLTDVLFRAGQLREAGAEAVVATLGSDGMVASTGFGCWHARIDAPGAPEIRGNPTGAGDAVVAALAIGVVEHLPWPDRLRQAAALSAAAVRHELAGGFDSGAYRELLEHVLVDRLPGQTAQGGPP